MKTTRQTQISLLVLVVALTSLGSRLPVSENWQVNLEPEGTSPIGFVNAEMFFIDEPVTITLMVSPVDSKGEIPNEWWKHTVLEVRQNQSVEPIVIESSAYNVDQSVRRKALRSSSSPYGEIVIPEKELDQVRVSLGRWQPGDYEVTVVLELPDDRPTMNSRRILVREGNESLDVRRTWLIHKSWAKPFEEAKPFLLELALMMAPDQWGYWKTLGDLSIGQAPVEETLDYYVRAERAIRERMKRDGETEFLERSLKQATIYRRILPILQQQEGRLGILIRGNAAGAQQEYHWFDRARERKLGRIDLDSPRFEGFERKAVEQP